VGLISLFCVLDFNDLYYCSFTNFVLFYSNRFFFLTDLLFMVLLVLIFRLKLNNNQCSFFFTIAIKVIIKLQN
jgi:hypothetical protein